VKGTPRILSVGARSALGLDARGLALALRAQKLAPRRLTLRDEPCLDAASPGHHHDVGTVRAAYLDDDVWGFDRLVELGGAALAEAVETCPVALPARARIVVAAPDARPSADKRMGRALIEALAARAGVVVDLARSSVVFGGHAGFAVALERALAESEETNQPILVGAIDTYHDPAALRWLEDEKRLHGPLCRDGFIPAEGAAFAVVTASGDARASGLAAVRAVVTGVDVSDEASEDPKLATAMTDIVRRAAEALPPGPLEWVLVDDNGERHRVKEWSFVTVRNRERFDPDKTVLDRPYFEAGDCGAATGGLLTAAICMGWAIGGAPAPRALIALHADGIARAAFVLEAPGAPQ